MSGLRYDVGVCVFSVCVAFMVARWPRVGADSPGPVKPLKKAQQHQTSECCTQKGDSCLLYPPTGSSVCIHGGGFSAAPV